MKTKAEKTEFVKYLAALASTFNRECDQAMQTGYWIGLEDVELAAFKKSVEVSMRACKFMPTVAELREFAGEMRIEDRAQLAFAALSDAHRRHSYYHSVDFDDRAINATVRALGGWEMVSVTDGKEWNSFFRDRFLKMYSAYARNGVSAEAAALVDRVLGSRKCTERLRRQNQELFVQNQNWPAGTARITARRHATKFAVPWRCPWNC